MSGYCKDCGNTICICDEIKDDINPKHYKEKPSGIECIEITEHMPFCIGNAIKYVWRYADKGTPVKDLKKALWYIDRAEKTYVACLDVLIHIKIIHVFKNDPNGEIIFHIAFGMFTEAKPAIEKLIAEIEAQV